MAFKAMVLTSSRPMMTLNFINDSKNRGSNID